MKDGHLNPATPAEAALADTREAVFWLDRPDTPDPADELHGSKSADLVVVGAGFTGLWTALLAAEADPGRRIVVLEAETAAFGASGRNGGFCEASLTHGLGNGLAHWPDELDTLLRLGDQNLDDLLDTIDRHAIDCDSERTGTMDIAVEPWQVDELRQLADASSRLGIDHDMLDTQAMRAEVDSPTYLAGLWQRTGAAMVDPARLAWGLQSAARSLGVVFHDNSPVRSVKQSGTGVRLNTPDGSVTADLAVVATNAYRKPLPRIRRHVIPVYDHVLMTEPLSADQWAAIRWHNRQGLADAGNQFHYYRRTADGRILWGGYDVLYHFGGRVGPAVEHHAPTTNQLAGTSFTRSPNSRGSGSPTAGADQSHQQHASPAHGEPPTPVGSHGPPATPASGSAPAASVHVSPSTLSTGSPPSAPNSRWCSVDHSPFHQSPPDGSPSRRPGQQSSGLTVERAGRGPGSAPLVGSGWA